MSGHFFSLFFVMINFVFAALKEHHNNSRFNYLWLKDKKVPTQIFTLSFTARKGDREVKAREDIRAKYLSLEGMDYLEQEMAERQRADSVEIESIEQDFYSKRIKIWTKATGKNLKFKWQMSLSISAII